MNFINKLRIGSDLTKLTDETELLVKRDAHGLPLSLPDNCYEGQSDHYLEKLEERLKRLSLMRPVDVTRELLKNQIVAR